MVMKMESRQAYQARYRQEHKAHIRALQERWRKNNRERLNQSVRRQYRAHISRNWEEQFALGEARREAGILQKELAAQLGTSITTVSHYETGATKITPERRAQYFKAIQDILDERS